MIEVFSDKANLKGIFNIPTKINEVKQKAIIEVNEEGTEAATLLSKHKELLIIINSN